MPSKILNSLNFKTFLFQARVKIVDKNDSPPVFRDDNLVISVSEDLIIGQPITTVVATDLDKTGTITYTLVSGDDGKFTLDSSKGFLTLRDTLNRESRSQYKLTVRADDGEQFTETIVVIKVRLVEISKTSFYFQVPCGHSNSTFTSPA